MRAVPKKLYKYRPFSANSVSELEQNIVYYANPKDFNDPLDCSPVVDIDIDIPALERLCFRMLVEVSPSKEDLKLAKEKAAAVIQRMRYFSTEPPEDGSPLDMHAALRWYLATEIQECLEKIMKRKGVLSLAQNWNCPLMWSHYGDQHKGICIELDSSDLEFATPVPVNYSGVRDIKASDLYDWQVKHLISARDHVHNAYFYRKAPQWKYEKEWRHVRDSNGVDGSPFLISAIYFGIRCNASVEAMITKLFYKSEREPKFYRINEDTKTFKLRRNLRDIDELLYESPSISMHWRHKEIAESFQDLTLDNNASS